MIAKVSSIFSTFLNFSIFLGIMLEIVQASAMLLVHKWATCNLSIPCKPTCFEDYTCFSHNCHKSDHGQIP